MRIALIASGSRGDIEPYLALGKGLQQAGHVVRFIAHENFGELVTAHGVEFWPIAGNTQDVAQSPEMRKLLEKGNFIAIMAEMRKGAQDNALAFAQGGLAACEGMELIIGGFAGMFIGVALAEKLNIPFMQAHYIPFSPTRAYPQCAVPKVTDVSRRRVESRVLSTGAADDVAGLSIGRFDRASASAGSAQSAVLGTLWG